MFDGMLPKLLFDKLASYYDLSNFNCSPISQVPSSFVLYQLPMLLQYSFLKS